MTTDAVETAENLLGEMRDARTVLDAMRRVPETLAELTLELRERRAQVTVLAETVKVTNQQREEALEAATRARKAGAEYMRGIAEKLIVENGNFYRATLRQLHSVKILDE